MSAQLPPAFDHSDRVVTEFRDIQSLPVYVDRKVIDPTTDIPK